MMIDGITAMRGKLALVTGGGRGIGAAIVRTLAAHGCDVLFTFRSSESEAEALTGALRTEWPEQRFEARHLDLVDRGAVEALASDIAKSDRLYALVHNAGLSYDALCAILDQDRAEALMQVNFWSMTRLVACAVRPMIRARSGRIVGIGSIVALQGSVGNAAYAASKGAMLSYMKTLAVELAGKGVTANTIAPGYVDTDMLAPYAAQREAVEKQIPAGRFAKPAEVASLVGYLLTPEAGYITGSVISIDGGLSAAVGVRR